jgi:hypothetical protein
MDDDWVDQTLRDQSSNSLKAAWAISMAARRALPQDDILKNKNSANQRPFEAVARSIFHIWPSCNGMDSKVVVVDDDDEFYLGGKGGYLHTRPNIICAWP